MGTVDKSWITSALLGFVCGLALIALISVTTGCAAKRPTRPVAHLAIPQGCVLDTSFTSKTVCVALPGHSDHSICSQMLVHHSCVKAVVK